MNATLREIHGQWWRLILPLYPFSGSALLKLVSDGQLSQI